MTERLEMLYLTNIGLVNKMAAANRRLAQWRAKWLIEHFTSHQLLWCIDSFVLRNPPLRQAPKRYGQGYGGTADRHQNYEQFG